MKRSLFLLLALVTLAAEGLSQYTPTPASLRSYVETALSQNPDVLASRAKWRNVDAQVDAAASNLYPKIDFTARLTRFWGGRIIDIPGFGAVNTAGLGLPPWDNKFEAVWPIGNLAVWEGFNISKSARSASTAEVSAKELDITYKVSEAYYQYAKATELVQVRKNSLAIAEENLKLANSLYSAERAQKNDVLRAEVGVASAEGDFISAKRIETLARTAFNSLLNRHYDEAITLPRAEEITSVTGTAGDVASATSSQMMSINLPPLRDDAEKAFSQRPELVQLAQTQNVLEGLKSVNSSDFYPNLAIFASYGWQEEDLKFSSEADNLVAGVQLKWNLFSGFGTNAKVAEAEAQIDELRFQRENALNGIRLEIESARTDKVSALERLAVARKAISSAEENYRITKLQYDNGTAPIITLIDAETTLANTKANFTTATYDLLIAEAKYKKALGLK